MFSTRQIPASLNPVHNVDWSPFNPSHGVNTPIYKPRHTILPSKSMIHKQKRLHFVFILEFNPVPGNRNPSITIIEVLAAQNLT